MKIDLGKMEQLLMETEGKEKCVFEREEKYKYQDMFFDIMAWTDLSKVSQYSLEEYQILLEQLPAFVGQVERNELGVCSLGEMLVSLKSVVNGQRRLL